MKNTKELNQEQKGITLIALVITVIVLLILAGVSIAMLTGNNGILAQANQAKKNNIEATAKEKVQLEVTGSFDNTGVFSKTMFKDNLKRNLKLTDSDIVENEDEIIIKIDGYDVAVNGVTGATIGDPSKSIIVKNPVTTGDIEDRKIELTWTELKQAANGIAIYTKNIGNSTTAVTVTVGNKTETLRVGNYKTIKYDGVDKKVRIIGFNSDTKINGKKAGITFDFVTILGMAPMNTIKTNVGGWGACEMKVETMPEMLAKLKLEDGATGLETIVETVKKDYNLGNAESINSSTPSEDKLWLLSDSEIFPKNPDNDRYAFAYTKEGEQYKYYELTTAGVAWDSDNPKLEKYESYMTDTNISNSSMLWWLRSPFYNENYIFCRVNSNGDGNGYGASNDGYCVAPGFSI